MFEFKILGNQEDPNGHPVPYERSTQRGQWLPRVKRYNAWKRYVAESFIKSIREELPISKGNTVIDVNGLGKPIVSKAKAHMEVFMVFRNKRHADPDNIWKGIADALFQNDNKLVGSFDYSVDKDQQPSASVKVTIY